MAKRVIEEEFDRLYSAYIENPTALPRLKKRVKRCRQPEDTSTSHQHTSTTTSIVSTCTSHDVISLCGSERAESDDIISIGAPNPTTGLESHTPSTEILLPTYNSPVVSEDDNREDSTPPPPHCNKLSSDESISCKDVTMTTAQDDVTMTTAQDEDGTSDIFMLHKPKMNRNLQRGKIFFKQYLKQQEALKLSKSKKTAFKQDPPSTTRLPIRDSSTGSGSSKQVAKKLTSNESNKVQKRKETKPKTAKRPRESKMETSVPKKAAPNQALSKSKTLGTKMKATGKQVWKKDDFVKKASLVAPSNQVWTQEDRGGRQVAVCRPNTKMKTSNQDKSADSKMNKIVGEDVLRQDATNNAKKRPLDDERTSEQRKSLDDTRPEDKGRSITPLFTDAGGHCGGIWKTIVDEC